MMSSDKWMQGVVVAVLLAVIAFSAYRLFGPRGSVWQMSHPLEAPDFAASGEARKDGAPSFGFEPKTIQGSFMKVVLPPDRIPSIDKPTFVGADDADIADDAPVIGVSLNGETHAYSVYLLDAHEIVNDQFGDQPVATTW